MTFQPKKRDDEALILAIVELLFIGVFIGVDIWYSSLSLMPLALLVVVWSAKIVMGIFVVLTWVKFNDPNYDKYRKAVVVLAVLLSLTIGIHHAVIKEDQQILEDSNSAKQEQAR